MSVFIELTTDAFQDVFNKQKGASDQARRAGNSNARRPSRGLEIKDDTYAVLKVVDASGKEIQLVDSGSTTVNDQGQGVSTSYTNFILQSVQEQRMEKHQIVETFGDSYIFFFGESPRFLDVSAVLVDSQDFNWEAEFWENYDQNLRGTKCVEIGARVYLFYEDTIVEGYMLRASAVKTSQTPLMVQMQFQLFLTNYSNVSFVGDVNFPIRPSFILPEGSANINVALDQNQRATLAANLAAAGFGGNQDLVSALQAGADPGQISPTLQGILSNASEAYGGTGGQMPSGLTRGNPIRSLISDNTDEYTGSLTPIDGGEIDGPTDPNLEAQDLHTQSMQAMNQAGANTDDPDTMNDLGLGPNFGQTGVGIGLGATTGIGASFGASFNASFGASASAGLGVGASAGYGFSGSSGSALGFGASTGFSAGVGASAGLGASAGAGAYAGVAVATGTLQDQQNAASYGDLLGSLNANLANALGPSTSYSNGVRVSGGIYSGVGVAGGVAGGLPPTILFSSTPTASGSINGIGAGANMNVGGAPSCFAMVSVGGTLSPDGFDASSSSFLS